MRTIEDGFTMLSYPIEFVFGGLAIVFIIGFGIGYIIGRF